MNRTLIGTMKSITVVITLALILSCGGGGGGGTPPPPPPNNEGSTASPLSLGTVSTTVTHPGSVGAFGTSFYLFTAGATSGSYGISLTSTRSDLSWELFSDSGFNTSVGLCDDHQTPGANNESCSVTLTAGATYYLAVDEWDIVAGTYVLTVTPPVVPSRPTGVTATASYGKVTLSWFVSAAATTYNVYWSTASGAGTGGNKIGNITTTNYSHVVSTPSITYYYVVTAENANGESVPSTPEVSAAPPAPLAPPLTYDFETNTLQGWTTNWIWMPSTLNAHGGTHSVTDSPIGMYANSGNTWLASPMLDLTGTSAPKLTFWHHYDIEHDSDNAYVELSSDGGAIWTNITPTNADGNRYTGTMNTYTLVTIDISAYKTSAAVVIRFRLQTDANIQHDGWYIDDIGISAN